MPQGLQVFLPSGALVIDISDRLTRVLGVIETTGFGVTARPTTAPQGSHTDARLSLGTPYHFFDFLPSASTSGYARTENKICPDVSYSGGALNWSYSVGGLQNLWDAMHPKNNIFIMKCKIIYGTY